MINNCMDIILSGAKSLLGKKSTKDILKYLGTVTITHLIEKYGMNKIKYDPMDLKNMVYHHNLNSDEPIDKYNIDQAIDVMNIQRFINNASSNNGDVMIELIKQLTHILNDNSISQTFNNAVINSDLKQFDLDTIETTSIADSYEINSGGIYLPDNNIYTSTIEGCNLANAKNEYLSKRIELGENVSQKNIQSLINDYHNRIEFDKVVQYFNN